MSGSVHIVIVNWNTGHRLRDCLRSIALAEATADLLARVTVVDNASSDDSMAGLEAFGLPLEIMRNSSNFGFGAACNQGASGSDADYVLFLNPDTRLFPDTLATVTRFMDSEHASNVGICGVRIVGDDGRPLISAARFPSFRVVVGKVTGLHHLLPSVFPSHHLPAAEIQESHEVDQVIGAFFFVRRVLFEKLGGFDPRYFLYFEEVDFALRARRQGASSYLLSEARIFHEENASSDQVPKARLFHSLRSRLLFAYEHWPRWQANLLVGVTLTIELAGRLMRGVFRRCGSELSSTVGGYARLLADLRGISRSTAPRNDPV
jgi:N-acetylglucosaminyl-diphospho-decaprenol L-rhamnosyltransferase